MSGTSDGTLPCVCSKRASLTAWDPFLEFDDKYLKNLDKLRREDAPNDGTTTYANLAFGNPQDPPLPELVEALKRQIEKAEPPHGRPDAFEYKVRLPESVDAVVNALMRTRSLQVDPDDVMLTNGALAALSLSAFVLGDPGDEAIMLTPSYFFYRPTIEYAGLIAVPVPSNAKEGFALDVEAIRGAISPKTRLILLNSPNNPTGKIYSMESLRALSSMLQDINLERRKTATDHYQPIVVISDEAYCRIVFDDIEFHSIAEVYPYSIMVYTWGKTLLAPSERFGYICLSPLMPKASRLTLRDRLFRAQILGWSFPNTTTARAYAEVEGANVKIDIERMQNRRDRLYNSLTENGWNAVKPDGGFYMLVEVPKDLFKDESDLLESLLEERILVLPGSIMDIDGWIRLSLTASDRMADFAIEGFRRLRCKRAAANPKS